ncbi:superfamily II DNA/RNA helicase [Wenyingzhuangia heitensis]|uniref:Superfamily II DNA/RNA helicase n=1 Tax=Wenyingzhuangia heitensis TaxID=1487859 RepID=A0ABX0UEU7_9FLAO|nr:DEAD/DEAH box helicase [Wenyingzhuangia heitensis]NIJ46400.1 superfamily II DNA/RNA helicase [Wenyingzhuangia heitensis]
MPVFPAPFKKLHSHLLETLERLEINTPTDFQKESISLIKSGTNLFCTAEKNSGKTTTLVLTTLQKLKCEAEGNTPRAIVLVADNDKGKEMNEAFLAYTRYSEIRVYHANEKEHIDLLKSEIFEGVDVLIVTPNTLDKLLRLYGVNLSQVKLFSIDDAEFLAQANAYKSLLAITESITKCQYVIYSEKLTPGIKRLDSYFMEHSRVVGV